MDKQISLSHAFRFGWQASIDNFVLNGQVVLVLLFFALCTGLILMPSCGLDFSVCSFSVSTGVLGFCALLFFNALYYGLLSVYLDIVDDGSSAVGRLFSEIDPIKILKLFCISVFYAVFIALGLICFIIPGFIVAARLSFAPFFIVEYDCGVFEAFEMSYDATKGNTLKILALLLVQGLMQPIKLLALFFPFAYIAQAHVYRQLVPQNESY